MIHSECGVKLVKCYWIQFSYVNSQFKFYEEKKRDCEKKIPLKMIN